MNFNKISGDFGLHFKVLLKKYGISQAKFSEDTQTHAGQVSRYVNGESPSGDFIMKVVSYFPKDISFLFFGEKRDELHEEDGVYELKSKEIIAEVEQKLQELKRYLSHKWHRCKQVQLVIRLLALCVEFLRAHKLQ